MTETFDDMAKEVMRKIQRQDKHALGVIRAALRKAYALGEKDAEQSVHLTGGDSAAKIVSSTIDRILANEQGSTPPASR